MEEHLGAIGLVLLVICGIAFVIWNVWEILTAPTVEDEHAEAIDFRNKPQ